MQTPTSITPLALSELLAQMPVTVSGNLLLPLSLPRNVQIVTDPTCLLAELDDPTRSLARPLLVTTLHPALIERFPWVTLSGIPSTESLNQHLGDHLDYAQQHLLTTHGIAEYIAHDVQQHDYRVVVLLLIDGLSYGDVLHWGSVLQPCFVDGPSVTYRLDDERHVVPQVGFASIINTPTLFARLYPFGYKSAHGFTYWHPEDNQIAEVMFKGIPTHRVVNFEGIIDSLRNLPLINKTYLQIVREGLDGLAHSKRELARPEIDGALQSIQQDIERLLALLKSKSKRVCIYVTADHGILWKKEHKWQLCETPNSKPRYTESRPSATMRDYAVKFETPAHSYYSYRYPYLGTAIRANDSGVHGGLSYQESFVPLAKFVS